MSGTFSLPVLPSRKCRFGASVSGLISAALTIGSHFAISALCQAPSASGVSWSGDGISRPRSSSRRFTAGSASASTTAALSRATMSLGVPFGTQSAFHNVMWKP